MYCKNCGTLLDDAAVICTNCGVATDNFYATRQANAQPSPQAQSQADAPNAGFAVLGFFFPLVGLILYLVWQNTMPLRAKSCGKGALIGVICSVAITIISVLFIYLLLSIIFVSAGAV